MNTPEYIAESLSSALSGNKERLIEEAISGYLGHSDWSPSDIVNRGEMIVLQGGAEILRFDGVDLIRFEKAEIATAQDETKTTLTAQQRYQHLHQQASEDS